MFTNYRLCYDGIMKSASIEPGLLRIFRWYAGLRFVLYLLAGLRFLVFPSTTGRIEFEPLPYLGWTLLGMAILLAYLSLPRLQKYLGQFYLPIGVIFAASSLILERVFTPAGTIWFWQPDPFLYVLLILVAWQYRFKEVVLFTTGTAVLEILLYIILPEQPLYISQMEGITGQIVAIGSLILRTISFLVIGFVITRLVSAQRRQRKALAEANIKLVQYAATVEQLAISRERNRLSRELHDTLAHTLSALAVQIDALMAVWKPSSGQAQEMLEKMLETTRRGLDETRRSLRNLRAAPLEEMGLALAIRSLAQDFAARNDLELELQVPEEINNLPPETEHGFYRVTQEALENTIRHAGAKQVRVSLAQDGSGLTLTVADDGRGFDTDSQAEEHQLGVQGMYERAELIGAELSVTSQVNEGTVVRLSKENGSGARIDM
jgi:signal transduction histidine kinase